MICEIKVVFSLFHLRYFLTVCIHLFSVRKLLFTGSCMVSILTQGNDTVYREIFAVKKFSRLSATAKIKRANYFQRRNKNSTRITVRYVSHVLSRSKEWKRKDGFVKMTTTQKRSSWSKRFVVLLNIIPGNCCSKSRSGRSHPYRI